MASGTIYKDIEFIELSGTFANISSAATANIDITNMGIDVAHGSSYVVDIKLDFNTGDYRSGAAYSRVKVIQPSNTILSIVYDASDYASWVGFRVKVLVRK